MHSISFDPLTVENANLSRFIFSSFKCFFVHCAKHLLAYNPKVKYDVSDLASLFSSSTMRNSGLLKWNKNNKTTSGKAAAVSNGDGKDSNASAAPDGKKWIHAAETLLQGHVVYLVKVRKRSSNNNKRDETISLAPGGALFTLVPACNMHEI